MAPRHPLEEQLREVLLVAVGERAEETGAGEVVWFTADLEVAGLGELVDEIGAGLGLTEAERLALLLCAAAELDPRHRRLLAWLLGRDGESPVTVGLLASLLADREGLEQVLDVDGEVRASGLLRVADTRPASNAEVALAPVVAAAALGARTTSSLAGAHLRRLGRLDLPVGRPTEVARLAALLASDRRSPYVPIVVVGADGAMALAEATDRSLVVLDLAVADDEAAVLDLLAVAALEDRLPVVEGLGQLVEPGGAATRHLLQRHQGRLVLWARQAADAVALDGTGAVIVTLPPASPLERAAAWRAIGVDDPDELADAFRVDIRRIADAAFVADAEAPGEPLDVDRAAAATRAVSNTALRGIAEPLPPGPSWDALVVAPEVRPALDTLRARLRNHRRVLDEWGLDRLGSTRGLRVLFAGESGTGKTLATRILATEHRLDTFRVDLSQLYSKWVGETEKQLDRLFDAAQRSGAVLFFDEAEVVLGKRAAADSSSGHLGNLSTAYLLQRIENHEGLTVLATNLRGNVDEAFLRRIDVLVDFGRPDAELRAQLWRLLLPPGAAVGADVDVAFLADRFDLTGGSIRNCVVNAAYLAADAGRAIEMADVIRSVALELAKLQRLVSSVDFGEHAHLVLT